MSKKRLEYIEVVDTDKGDLSEGRPSETPRTGGPRLVGYNADAEASLPTKYMSPYGQMCRIFLEMKRASNSTNAEPRIAPPPPRSHANFPHLHSLIDQISSGKFEIITAIDTYTILKNCATAFIKSRPGYNSEAIYDDDVINPREMTSAVRQTVIPELKKSLLLIDEGQQVSLGKALDFLSTDTPLLLEMASAAVRDAKLEHHLSVFKGRALQASGTYWC